MGNRDWTEENLARDWNEGFGLMERMEREGVLPHGESAALADGVLRCMNGALVKVSEVLEAQALLRRELAALRDEQARAERERRESEARKDERIAALELELRALREAQARLRGSSGGLATCPAEAFLARPMVIRSSREAYLGVCDSGGKALRLCDFLRLIEAADTRRLVSTSWEPAGDGWVLNIGMTRDGAQARAYSLTAAPVRTPSGNLVTLLKGMTVGDEAVPHAYLMRMFRQLREAMQE